MERRGTQAKSSYDLLSWSSTPDDGSLSRAPVRHNATNNSQQYSMANDESPTESAPLSRPAIRILQPPGASQIQFCDDFVSAMPKGNGVDSAKQRELSGTAETFLDQPRRPMSDAKAKEMSGSNIFSTSFEDAPDRRRSRSQKAAELCGNGIFDVNPNAAPEKSSSQAKKREMTGNDIFSDFQQQHQQAPPVQNSGRIRKPPDVAAKIQQFIGTNPARPDEKATAECVAKRMAENHISEAKMKEMNGNYDLFKTRSKDCDGSSSASLDQSCLDRKSEKQHSGAKRQEIVGNYDLLSYAPDRQDNAAHMKREKPASQSKLKELSGSYIFGDCFSVPP